MNQIENVGREGKDRITGFSGTITGVVFYVTGCAQYLITPKVKKDNDKSEPMWFDETRILIMGDKRVMEPDFLKSPPRLDGSDTPAPCKSQHPLVWFKHK